MKNKTKQDQGAINIKGKNKNKTYKKHEKNFLVDKTILFVCCLMSSDTFPDQSVREQVQQYNKATEVKLYYIVELVDNPEVKYDISFNMQ